MSIQSKIHSLDMFIKSKEHAEEVLKMAKKRNIDRKIDYHKQEIIKLEKIKEEESFLEAY
jgi:hypothetical protein